MDRAAPLGHCNAGVLTVWTLGKLSQVEPVRIFLWSSPSYFQLLSCLIVSLEGESRNAGASLAEQNIEDVWGHAHCWERHPAKTISHRQWVFRGRWNVDKLKLSGRQAIHISYCSRRHLLPSVYPSFNKPMSHATYFWGQVISHFMFVPRWAGLDTGAAAGGEGLGFGARSTGTFVLWFVRRHCSNVFHAHFCLLDSNIFRSTQTTSLSLVQDAEHDVWDSLTES